MLSSSKRYKVVVVVVEVEITDVVNLLLEGEVLPTLGMMLVGTVIVVMVGGDHGDGVKVVP